MTEPRSKRWIRRRPGPSGRGAGRAGGALSSALVLHLAPFVQVADADDGNGAGFGFIIALIVAGVVGLVLLWYLVRPFFGSSEEQVEPEPGDNSHEERWARWEAGANGNQAVPEPSSHAALAQAQAGEDAVIGSAAPVDSSPEPATPPVEVSPNGATAAGIFATVNALLDCANDGAMLSGFGLYSDRFFRRFALEADLSLGEFLHRYQNQGARQSGERLRVERLHSVTPLLDGRISADVVYGPHGALDSERYTFEWSTERNRWLIDDIQPA